MPFSESVKVMLYARSGNRCAYPGCPVTLVFTEKQAGAVVNFGRAAHIVAESPKGPRGRSPMSLAERNSYENGVVLCSPHHTDVVDSFPEKFPVRLLREWKKAHEKRYGNGTPSIGRASKYLPLYAEYIDRWAQLARIDGWRNWTGPMLRAGAWFMNPAVYESYIELCSWLANRIWPGKLRGLENAFHNFRRVATDLIFTFDKHAENDGRLIRTDKFYSRSHHAKYSATLERFEYHVALLEDLILELTRAANLICDEVRTSVDAQFRLEEGRLMVESGIYPDFGFRRHVPQYSAKERTVSPYPGLREFMKKRENRDNHFGSGVREDYFRED
jgi:hypothetical protein